MAELSTGIKRALKYPVFYNLFSNIIGARKFRQFFVDRYVLPNSRVKILDIGCGTSEILDLLPLGVDYVGYDLSDSYISAARLRFGQRGIWHCASVADMSLDEIGTFDIVIAIGILHHLSDADARRLIEISFNALKRNGRFVNLENAFTWDQSLLSRFFVSQDRGQNIRTPLEYSNLFKPYFNNCVFDVHHDLLRIPYTHAVFLATKD